MRVRMIVAYDGTDYSGFQRQADVPTIQEELETALAQLTQESITVLMAGRTDAGVHALGQVVAFDTAWRHGIDDLHRAMNAVLPADIAVRKLSEATPDFHPRYDARRRHYRYALYNAPVRSPLTRRYALHVADTLDLASMQQAARCLIGEQDFATFGRPPQGDVTVRRVFEAEWRREPHDRVPFEGAGIQESDRLNFDIEANAFLYRMVRSVVGTLLEVGQGRMSVEAFEEALASHQRSRAGQTAPAHGLCLMRVGY